MHATIVLCLMMVGGPVQPEPELTQIPLARDPDSLESIMDLIQGPVNIRVKGQLASEDERQDKIGNLQWQQQRKKPLPHVPTIIDEAQSSDRYRKSWQRRSSSTNEPNSMRPQTGAMPTPPTESE